VNFHQKLTNDMVKAKFLPNLVFLTKVSDARKLLLRRKTAMTSARVEVTQSLSHVTSQH
jgi:hypothetical protein